MKVQKISGIVPGLTFEDHAALEHTEIILNQLLEAFGNETTLVSAETGEVIQMSELPRVLGILSGLREHRCWTVEI